MHSNSSRRDQSQILGSENLDTQAAHHRCDRLLTTTEVGRILGLSTKTVAAWAKSGRFPNATKTSAKGEWRIPSSDAFALFRVQAMGGDHGIR